MMISDTLRGIAESIQRMRKAGWNKVSPALHGFRLNACLSETCILHFEDRYQVSLPADYRRFLMEVGNGGAGPGYGLFELGRIDSGEGHAYWEEGDGTVGSLRVKFPFRKAWNDRAGEPKPELRDIDEDAYRNQLEAFEEVYSQPIDGAIPLCHHGCGIRDWLVVSGRERGHVWVDDRGSDYGIYPYTLKELERVSFTQWYRGWSG